MSRATRNAVAEVRDADELYAADVARLEGRSPSWAQARMRAGDFGPVHEANQRVKWVTGAGYLAWRTQLRRRATR